jgi:predicted GNAT family N-acyltransferase
MNISIQITHWSNAKNMVMPIRHEIFINEQKVPEELEWDELDQDALHAIVKKDHQVIGTARLMINSAVAKIGRMAIKKEYRQQGIGQKLLSTLIQTAKEKGAQECILHAQTHAIAFYAKADFEPHGPIFDEAGIPHVEMRLTL